MPPSSGIVRARLTLHADGPSDRVLLAVIEWILRERDPARVWESQWADLACIRIPMKTLGDRLRQAVELYPCDVLFVHRDQERGERAERLREIAASAPDGLRVVPVIPVRMTEAWLLLDEEAIRSAAGNPRGRQPLALPKVALLEEEPDPKERLHEALRVASGLSGRRLDKLRPTVLVHDLAWRIRDFAPLRQLAAFRTLEEDIVRMVALLGDP